MEIQDRYESSKARWVMWLLLAALVLATLAGYGVWRIVDRRFRPFTPAEMLGSWQHTFEGVDPDARNVRIVLVIRADGTYTEYAYDPNQSVPLEASGRWRLTRDSYDGYPVLLLDSTLVWQGQWSRLDAVWLPQRSGWDGQSILLGGLVPDADCYEPFSRTGAATAPAAEQ